MSTHHSSLSPRLHSALNLLDLNASLADIGCDHGRLGIAALLEGCPYVVFVDKVESIVSKLRLNIPHGIQSERFSLTVGDAGDTKFSTVEQLVFCGMGAKTVCGVLEKTLARRPEVSRIVYQVAGNVGLLEAALNVHGFSEEARRSVDERGRTVHIVSATRGVAQR